MRNPPSPTHPALLPYPRPFPARRPLSPFVRAKKKTASKGLKIRQCGNARPAGCPQPCPAVPSARCEPLGCSALRRVPGESQEMKSGLARKQPARCLFRLSLCFLFSSMLLSLIYLRGGQSRSSAESKHGLVSGVSVLQPVWAGSVSEARCKHETLSLHNQRRVYGWCGRGAEAAEATSPSALQEVSGGSGIRSGSCPAPLPKLDSRVFISLLSGVCSALVQSQMCLLWVSYKYRCGSRLGARLVPGT